jgi:predicted deacylase
MSKPSQKLKRSKLAPGRGRPIELAELPAGARTDLRLPIYQDALSRPLEVPFVVVRGRHPGPVLGLSAAVHGDELNGIKIIHHVLEQLEPSEMHGSLVCAPVVNVPAFQAGQRRFPEDDLDLNHVFPGKKEGRPSEQYARAFVKTFLPPLDYLVDIHTASEGRINSFYVRADLHQEEARRMALLINPEIVLHSRSGDGTLRNAARVRETPAITLEAGNPSVFQGRMVLEGELGLMNILTSLHIVRGEPPQPIDRDPVICHTSKWLRTTSGGLLHTRFQLRDRLEKKQLLAEIVDPFGKPVHSYHAPSEGIVIGMSKSPVAVPGTRYCHLGAIGEPPPPRSRRSREASALPAGGPTP